MIEILSGIDKRARRKAYRGFVVENIAGAEDVLFHVFRCQRIIDKNCSYNILTMQTSAKYISVFNPSNKTFVVLDQDSPEQITYSEIASELILKDYNSWLEKYERNTDHMLAIPENERRKIEKQSISLRDIYGVFFRPENVFRIQDMRTNAVYFTASGKVNKSKKPKTKKNFSYSVEELIDIILYLHIEDSLIEKIGSDPRLFAANLERQKNELRRASYDDILTLLEKNLNGVSSKPIDLSSFRENSDTVVFEDDSDTEINEAQQEQAVIIDQYDSKKKNKKEPSALLKLLANRRKYYINHPDRFLLFYIFYVNKDMGKYPSKDTHVEILQEHFKQENRIYEFR
jgi:hypothetical protein